MFQLSEVHIEKGGKRCMGSGLTFNMMWNVRPDPVISVEPDAVYCKNEISIFIDAKYKSNLYNRASSSDSLNEEHRRDLHQIMAYSSFSNTNFKYGVLCYPSDKPEINKTIYTNAINGATNTMFICGIPLKITSINETKKLLTNEIYNIEKYRNKPSID